MKQRIGPWLALAVPLVLLCTAVTASAAEQGEGHTGQTLQIIFKWLHFLLVAGLVYWVFAKVLPPVFRRNADNISAAITKATRAKAEAERQLKDAERRLAGLEQEIERFRSEARALAAAEFDRLRAMARNDVEKIRLAAKAEIEAAERAARVELKALAAKMAVDRAESLVTKQMTPTLQEAMINRFVESLEGRPN
jgi:F-type H+-transporting ATPase subunit b